MNKVETKAEIVEIVRCFKVWKFKNAKTTKKWGFKLKRLGSGAFREVYLVNDVAVVKFPIKGYEDNLYHSQKEIKAIRKINKQVHYKVLRPFLPKVYYTDYRHGVILVERCYKLKAGIPHIVADILGKVFESISEKTSWASDIEYYNVMENSNGDYKLIDLGLF